MKRAISIFLAALLLFSLIGCGAESAEKENVSAAPPVVEPSETESSVDAPAEPAKSEYAMGETWTVDGQWTLTVDSVEETAERNEYEDKQPAAVYLVTFTYTNIGYESPFMDGLFFIMDDSIVDSAGMMGYSYPGDVTYYPQETPIGATCKGQVCIGVDNPGDFKIYVDTYDGTETEQKAVFIVQP